MLLVLGGVGLFAACLDDKNPALPNEAPNRHLIFAPPGSGGGGVGGGPADNCECVAAYVVAGGDCATCVVNQLSGTSCSTQLAPCTGNGGGSAGGAGGTGPETCNDVRGCVNNCGSDAACAINCILPADLDQGHTDYNALLSCVCGACGSACKDPGVTCASGSGGSTATTTTTLTAGGS